MRTMLLSLLLAAVIAVPALAEEKPAATPPAASPPPVQAPSNPHLKAMNDQAKELAATMSEAEASNFAMIRDNFGVIGSISIARKSVDEAVKLCAEKNPDMKTEITTRHKSWDEAIGAELSKQEKVMDSAITKDRFKDPAKVKAYLDTIDKAAHYADSSIAKSIVTTPEACKNLMGSMDDTQKVIIGHISSMKWPSDNPAKIPEAPPAKLEKTSAPAGETPRETTP